MKTNENDVVRGYAGEPLDIEAIVESMSTESFYLELADHGQRLAYRCGIRDALEYVANERHIPIAKATLAALSEETKG